MNISLLHDCNRGSVGLPSDAECFVGITTKTLVGALCEEPSPNRVQVAPSRTAQVLALKGGVDFPDVAVAWPN